jgi:hypothetical protein
MHPLRLGFTAPAAVRLRLAPALKAGLQMQLDEVGRLGEPQPALAGGPLAPFQFLENCFIPAFRISLAGDFKFLHLDTRHHGAPLQQVFIGT